MKKSHAITFLRDAKKSHLWWVSHASAIVAGHPVEQDEVPLHSTECAFGCWYYGNGSVLSPIPAFRRIDEPHQRLHDIYLRIHVLLKVGQKEQDNSRLGRLLGTGRKLKAEKQAANAEARSLLQDMKAASREIVAQVDDLQAVLLAMSDVEFDALMAAQGLRNTPPKLSLVTQKVA
jgi:hypothetical protein